MEVTLDCEYEGTGKDPWGGTRAGARATATIDRRDWGLKWNQALETGGILVANEVRIEVEVQAVKQYDPAVRYSAIAFDTADSDTASNAANIGDEFTSRNTYFPVMGEVLKLAAPKSRRSTFMSFRSGPMSEGSFFAAATTQSGVVR